MITTIEWKSITEPPLTAGYVLLAITHNNIPAVIMGHYKKYSGFTNETYDSGGHTQYYYWAAKPVSPLEATT